jgi:dolichyl-phosphate beta-glucosyltransferase
VKRASFLLVERFVLWAVVLAVVLPDPADKRALEFVLALGMLFFARSIAPAEIVQKVSKVVAALLLGALSMGVIRDGVSVAWIVTFAVCALSVVSLFSTFQAASTISDRALVVASLPILLLIPALRTGLASSILFSLTALILYAASRYHAKPLLESREDVQSALSSYESPDDVVELSVVLPAFNVGPRLKDTVEAVHAALDGISHEVLVISDGSTDGAPETLDQTAATVIVKQNGGKGTAVATGVLAARGAHIAFLDADGDIAPSHLPVFLAEARVLDASLVVGSKSVQGAEFDSSLLRRTWSWGFRTLQRTLLNTRVSDSQVGLKLGTASFMKQAVRESREAGFLLDLELLTHASRRDLTIAELPVRVRRDGGTTVSPKTVLDMLSGTLCLAAHRLCHSRSVSVTQDSGSDELLDA